MRRNLLYSRSHSKPDRRGPPVARRRGAIQKVWRFSNAVRRCGCESEPMTRVAEDKVGRCDSVRRESADAHSSAWSARRGARIWMLASLMLLILVGVGTAAEVPVVAAARTGKLPGMISGLLLLALLGYSIYIYAAPLLKNRDRSLGWALAILSVVALIKILLLPWFDGYKNDISSYESWALQMATQGPAGIYRTGYFLD